MTRERLRWKVREDWTPFFCFSNGCYEEARYIVRVDLGPASLQLCLCGDCSNQPPESMIDSVTAKNNP